MTDPIMIKTLGIEGFRGFQFMQSLDLAIPNGKVGSGLTIFVGPNNSGKSTIIEILRLFSLQNSPSFTEGRRNITTQGKIHINLTNTKDEVKGIMTLSSGGSETALYNTMIEPQHSKIFVLPSRRQFEPYFGRGGSDRQAYIYNTASYSRGSPLNYFSSRLFSIQENRTEFDKVLSRVIYPLPQWIIDQADNGSYYIKLQSGDHFHTSEGVGEGIISLLFIIDALYDSKPGDIIAIDEPELSLHPSIQRSLADLIYEYSKDRQIIYSTHSPYFMKLDWIVDGAKVYRIHKTENGSIASTISDDTIKSIKGLLNNRNNPHIFGLDAREVLFLDDKIILVEGQEDVIFYRMIAEEIGAPLNGSFFGWGVGGASNMIFIAQLLNELGFKNVIGILDNDKRDVVKILKIKFPQYEFFIIPAQDVRTKKARPPVIEVEGLLNDKNKLRSEYKDEIESIFSKIIQRFNN